MTSSFLDTSILVYAFTNDERSLEAQTLLDGEWTTSVHALNEFAAVTRRKFKKSWPEVQAAVADITAAAQSILPVDLDTHADAVRLSMRYGYGIFDALMVASTLRAGCETLWSEDMHDGMQIDGRLRIRNPFARQAAP
jgi:predicted nucleic acid-binding protein